MKRPEGFDPPGKQTREPTRPVAGSVRAQKPTTTQHPTTRASREKASAAPRPGGQRQVATERLTPLPPVHARPRTTTMKNAARESRRFTRRTRTRRTARLVILGVVAALIAVMFLAVFSPLLALRTITVDGTSRVSAAELRAAVADQLGTPLALVDFGKITTELSAFPLIRSYVTETVPPDTLVIHVVERQPVGELLAAGIYTLVDPAGVVLQSSVDRIGGVPVIDLGGNGSTSPAFESVVQVLLAMPPRLLGQIDSITAKTQDDVVLVLSGAHQRVEWGSAENSARKADVLSRLIAITDPAKAGEFDVSAPGNAIFTPS